MCYSYDGMENGHKDKGSTGSSGNRVLVTETGVFKKGVGTLKETLGEWDHDLSRIGSLDKTLRLTLKGRRIHF